MKSQIIPKETTFKPIDVLISIETADEFGLFNILTNNRIKVVRALNLNQEGEVVLLSMLEALGRTLGEAA